MKKMISSLLCVAAISLLAGCVAQANRDRLYSINSYVANCPSKEVVDVERDEFCVCPGAPCRFDPRMGAVSVGKVLEGLKSAGIDPRSEYITRMAVAICDCINSRNQWAKMYFKEGANYEMLTATVENGKFVIYKPEGRFKVKAIEVSLK